MLTEKEVVKTALRPLLQRAYRAGRQSAAVPPAPPDPGLSQWEANLRGQVNRLIVEMNSAMQAMVDRTASVEARLAAQLAIQNAEAFADAVKRVDAVLERNQGKTPPLLTGAIKQEGVEILTKKTFAADSDRLSAFNQWAGALDAMPVRPEYIPPRPTGPRVLTPLQQRMVRPGGLLDRVAPQTTRKIREGRA